MKKIFLICSLLISAIVFAQPVVQRASPANTPDDPNHMSSRMSIIPRYADTIEANTKYTNLDSAGKIIYTRDIKGFWYRQDYPKKWVRVVSDNNLSNNFFFDSTCNCYKIDTSSLMGIVNTFNTDSSITSISIINDSTIRICYGEGNCVNIGIVTNITNINTIQFLGGDTIQVCNYDTLTASQTCDTIVLGVNTSALIFQNGLRKFSNIVEIGQPYSGGGNPSALTHNTWIYTSFYKLGFEGTPVFDYVTSNEQLQRFQIASQITSFKSIGSYFYNESVRLGVNYTGDIALYSPDTINGNYGRERGYWIGTNASRGNNSNGWQLDNSNAKSAGIFFNTDTLTTTNAISFFAIPPNPSVSIPMAYDNKLLTLHNDGLIQFDKYNSTNNLVSDTSRYKIAVFDSVDGTLKKSNWFGGGGTDSAFVKITALNDTSALWERSNRAIPADTLRISLATGDKGDIIVYGGWTNWQLDTTTVTPGTYTNTTLTVDSKGRITAASNGSSGGSVNDFRLLPFQIDSSRNAPASGASYFLLPSSYSTKRIIFYREGEEQRDTTNGVKDYQYLRHNDTVFVFPNFFTRERCLVQAYPDSNWTVDVFPGFDPDAQAYFSAVSGAGGSLTNLQKTAINQFVLDLKSAGIYSTHFDFIHFLFGGSAAATKFNLINPVDADAAYRLTFVNSATFASTGITTNGTNQYINSHFIGGLASHASSNDYHLSAYQRTAAGVDGALWGVSDASTAEVIYTIPKAASGSGAYRDLDVLEQTISPTTAKGLWMTIKTATNGTIWQDGVQKGTGADNGAGNTLGSVEPLAFNAWNSNATIALYHAAEISLITGGKGMNGTQRVAFETAVANLISALGL